MVVNYLPTRGLCQLIGSKIDFDLIRNKFSVFNDASRHSHNPYVNNIDYTITPTGLCRVGMIEEFENFARAKNIVFNLSDDIRKIIYPETNYKLYGFTLYDYYDYQKECLNKLLKKGRGLCVVGTGGGKTIIQAGLIESYFKAIGNNFKCLLLVDGTSMIPQTIDKFKQYGVSFTVGKWNTNDIDLKYNCNIINNHYITNKKNINIAKKIFKNNIDLLIMDEVHHATKGNIITKFVDSILISHKYGFTGTIPPKQIDAWTIQGIFGSIVYEKPSYELRQENKLTNTEVKILNIKYKHPPKFKFDIGVDEHGNEYIKDSTEVYDKEYQWIFQNEFRNKLICKICNEFDKNILILVNSLQHLDILYNFIKLHCKNKTICFIKGEVDLENRKNIFEILEKQNNIVCIAMSTIFSTGIDVSNINMVMFAAGGQSFIRVVQSIGRGIRLNKNKNKLYVIDIADKLKYGIKHLNSRKEIYTKEKFPYKEYEIIE